MHKEEDIQLQTLGSLTPNTLNQSTAASSITDTGREISRTTTNQTVKDDEQTPVVPKDGGQLVLERLFHTKERRIDES